jgi:hypothetical protein
VAEEESTLKRARFEVLGVPLPESDDDDDHRGSDDEDGDEVLDSVEGLFDLLHDK